MEEEKELYILRTKYSFLLLTLKPLGKCGHRLVEEQ